MEHRNSVLIVEDDVNINGLLKEALEKEGYICTQAFSGTEARMILQGERYSVILLDLMLPGIPGEEVLRDIRKKGNTPVIILTAKDTIDDKVEFLRGGADDYVTKPFSPSILKRKIAVILKRTGQNEKRDQGQYDDGYLRIDFDKMTAQRGTETLLLTPNEYRILKLFVENAGRILTRQVFLERLYDCDENFIDEHTLTVNMTRLRKKIEDTSHKYIQTIYGMGYLFARGEGHEA